MATAQTVLLDDDFQADIPDVGSSPDGIPQPEFNNWNVIEGTVDLLSDVAFNWLCADALDIDDPSRIQCVDLDGTSNPAEAGTMETKETFALLPGTVELMFDLAGSQFTASGLNVHNTVTVSLGSVFSEEFSKDFGDPFETITREIALAAPTAATLIFDHAGGDNVGLLLDNVKLTQLTVLGLTKEITSGPDLPNRLKPNAVPQDPDDTPDGEIDLVVQAKQSKATQYGFKITDGSGTGTEVLILDTLPNNWQMTAVNGTPVIDGFLGPMNDGNGGEFTVSPTNGKDNNKSSTQIEWRPDPDSFGSTLNVVAETRGKKAKEKKAKEKKAKKKKKCGRLTLNEGAVAFEIDDGTGQPKLDPYTGQPLPPLFETASLLLAGLKDVDGDGILVRDGSGDEDQDGLTDIEEARDFDTNPCSPDTDLDGALDGVDADPLDPNVQ